MKRYRISVLALLMAICISGCAGGTSDNTKSKSSANTKSGSSADTKSGSDADTKSTSGKTADDTGKSKEAVSQNNDYDGQSVFGIIKEVIDTIEKNDPQLQLVPKSSILRALKQELRETLETDDGIAEETMKAIDDILDDTIRLTSQYEKGILLAEVPGDDTDMEERIKEVEKTIYDAYLLTLVTVQEVLPKQSEHRIADRAVQITKRLHKEGLDPEADPTQISSGAADDEVEEEDSIPDTDSSSEETELVPYYVFPDGEEYPLEDLDAALIKRVIEGKDTNYTVSIRERVAD